MFMVDKKLNIFKSLADETRLKIVTSLIDGEKCVCEIFPHVKKTQSTVSIHLNNLEKRGAVQSRRQGKYVYYKIADKKIIELIKLLEKK
jgi:ArsR family transcriptional regulator, arsenate/arsenite/antimonite-responsive transcriptional repressor